MINFKQLEALYWLRELGSFQRVADRLHVTQPAVSARVATLEEAVGARLVDRGPAGVTLTRLGLEAADHAERLIVGRDAMLEAVRRDRQTVLRIAAVGPVMHTWGAHLKRMIRDEEPSLAVEFSIGSNVQIERDIRAGAVDLAFLALLPGSVMPAARLSMDYAIAWIASPEVAAAVPQPADTDDLAACERVLYPPTSPLYSPVPDLLSRTGSPRHFANSLSSILDLLRLGFGISAIPAAVARTDIAAGRLQRIQTCAPIPPLSVYCAHVVRQRERQADKVLALAERAIREAAAVSDGDLVLRG